VVGQVVGWGEGVGVGVADGEEVVARGTVVLAVDDVADAPNVHIASRTIPAGGIAAAAVATTSAGCAEAVELVLDAAGAFGVAGAGRSI
jgi:hypothetical protein